MCFRFLFSEVAMKPNIEEDTGFIPCDYKAPLIAVRNTEAGGSKRFKIIQSNCHHWDCRRCGVMLARLHYGHIVYGAKKAANKNTMYFFTITSKGSDISMTDAQENYYMYTNRLLSSMRYQAKKSSSAWKYVQITERQKRGHPHSHFITTFVSNDMEIRRRWKYQTVKDKKKRKYYDTLRSDWVETACQRAGLGTQYYIDEIKEPEAMASYIAKYLFKTSALEQWPDKWKRVRYSRSWDKIPLEDKGDALALLTSNDWQELSHKAVVVTVEYGCEDIFERTWLGLYGSDVLINYKSTPLPPLDKTH